MKRRSDYRPVVLACPACSKVFETTEYRVRYGHKYCSRECACTRDHHGPHRPLEERFWEKVKKGDGCWIWQASLNNKGYGQITIDGKRKSAHRIAWQLTNGAISPGAAICHKCDHPACVRPDHLFLGTMAINQRDMAQKGRSAHGSKHKFAKLNEAQVYAIRIECAQVGIAQRSVAHKYGVSEQTISGIVHRRTWKHVD